jgi:hypothetical protein
MTESGWRKEQELTAVCSALMLSRFVVMQQSNGEE